MFATGLGIATIILAVTTSLVDNLFAGNVGLVICLVIALFTFGFELLARGRVRGRGRVRRLRRQHGRRGHHPPAPLHRARRRRIDRPGRLRSLPRHPARAGDARRAARSAPAHDPGARGAVVGALDQPRPAARRLVARAGAELRAVSRRPAPRHLSRAGDGRRLHRRPVPVAHSDPAVPGGAGRVAAAARGAGERGPDRRLPPRHAQPPARGERDRRRRRDRRRDARPVRRPPPLRRQVRARQPRPRPARGRERDVHLRPHHVAGVDRARRARDRCWCRGWSAWSRSSWRRWCRRPTCSPGWRSARSSARGRPRSP